MALQKQAVPINFAQGLDGKTDPFQVAPGKFLALKNSVFDKAGRLTKRNGFGLLATLPDTSSIYATTFNDNLLAIGNRVRAYANGTSTWVDKGPSQLVHVSTAAAIRSSNNQSQADSARASNGLTCIAYTDNTPSPTYKYTIVDSATGQVIINPTAITPVSGTVAGSPKVFVLGNFFIVVYTSLITATYHLEYFAISIANPTAITASTNITSQYTPSSTVAWDGYVANNNLYLAWNGSDLGGAIRATYIDSTLAQHNTISFAGKIATLMSITADTTTTTPTIYISFYNSGTQLGYTAVLDSSLTTITSPTAMISATAVANITSTATGGVATLFYEVTNAYSYDSGIPTNYIKSRTITQAGSAGTATTVIRSVGLASKAFAVDGINYFLAAYKSDFQPTYFLANESGEVVAKLAYSNGGGYLTTGLPDVTVTNGVAEVTYLIKDLIQAANKSLNVTNTTNVYSQTGINLASFQISADRISSVETGHDLHLSGGFLWMYDGVLPVEHGFHLYPDDVELTVSHSGGSMTTQDYFYQVTYEWTDNQGNIFRSAPSIPVQAATGSFSGSANSVTLNIPTLRLTYKIASPVKIVIYRWSNAQQTFYQVTSITTPLLNDTTVDSVSYVDTQADSSILGNSILYTTGGVVENIGAPATDAMTAFQSRLFLIDAEDTNLLWYSKQIIENTPVEMSDLFTIFVSPTIGVNGSTGGMKALSAMDDKLIIFKDSAIYYINGSGPDNTGTNSQFSEPTFITATVGSSNQQSIVFMPNGLMFQSDKGIWLLGRDLSTTYIGAPVENFTQGATVLSAVNVPGTNQVRFTLDSGITLMYDYYYGQWGTFYNVPAVSSCIFESLHTYINARGQALQETPGTYLDGSQPTLMSFTTSWFNLAGLQGYERAYFFYLLGIYQSPHKLSLQIAYDYNSSPTQFAEIDPDNHNEPWGGEQLWGSGNFWGGSFNVEQWRVFLQTQKCEAFQITMNESFDPSFGEMAGSGLTISGLDLVVGIKSGYPRVRASRSVG